MSPPTTCKGLRDLKGELKGLEVDEKLLDIMKKWNCLTEKQAKALQETPMANRVESMLSFLNGRGPSHWSLMICVFLELGRDELALKTWKAVQTQLRLQLNVTSSKRADAMDFWDEFVRRMLAALVFDQHEKDRKEVVGAPALGPLTGPHKETASDLWKQIVDEAAAEKTEPRRMWKMLASHLAGAVKASRRKQNAIDSQTIKGVWNVLIDSALKLLKGGDRERCRVMLNDLLESVRTTFDDEAMEFIHCQMLEVCREIYKGPQKTFVNDIRKMLIENCRLLLEESEDHQKSAENVLLRQLISSTSAIVESMIEAGAVETAVCLWKELIKQVLELPLKKKEEMVNRFYTQLEQFIQKSIDSQILEGMRTSIPSGPWPDTPPRKPLTKALVDGFPTERSRLESSDPSRYSFKPGPTNLALVINNVDFIDGEDKRRDGSEMDELALTSLLKRLGFHVKQMTNLTKDRLLKEIDAFAKRPDHEDADAAVLAVMTHGGNEALEGHDRKLLPFQSVIDCFCDESAPNLAGKPKWLIFQACRNNSEEDEEDEDKPDKPISEGSMSYNDMLITYTASPGRTALRNIFQGTWYVHALKKVLDTKLCEFSLLEIHSEVLSNMLALWDESGDEKHEKPTQELRTLGWRKNLYFKDPVGEREVLVETESLTSSATTRDRRCETPTTPTTSLCATADLAAVARTEECQPESGRHHCEPYSGWDPGTRSSESGRSAPAESRGVEEAMRSPTPQNSGVGAKVDTVLQLLASISQEQHDFRTFVTSQFRALNDRLRELELRVGERDTQGAERSSPH